MPQANVHREIEGSNAAFKDGCMVSDLVLDPYIRITNKFTVKTDANSVKVSWQNKHYNKAYWVKDTLQTAGGRLQYFQRAPSNGRPTRASVAGFPKPENALKVVKHCRSLRGIEIMPNYTVHFTAPKAFMDVVLLDVEEVLAQSSREISTKWLDQKHGMVILRLSGTERDRLVEVKKVLEAIFTGHIASWADRGIWHDFFATSPGKAWLENLGQNTQSIITGDKLQQRIHLYSLEQGTRDMSTIERRLAEKVAELEVHTVQLDTKVLRKIISSAAIKRVRTKFSKAIINIDIVQKTLTIQSTRDIAELVLAELDCPQTSPGPQEQECPICLDSTKDIIFSSCKHRMCRDCFDQQLEIAATNLFSRRFPIVCEHEGCRQPVTISDLRQYATSNVLERLFKASTKSYIRCHPAKFKFCRTPDCEAIYRVTTSKMASTSTCRMCLAQTCTGCHEGPHIGLTCEENAAHHEEQLEEYKRRNRIKDCPKCGSLLAKEEGCDHIECAACQAHICWVCLQVFAESGPVYEHMNEIHGGNGLVGVWGF